MVHLPAIALENFVFVRATPGNIDGCGGSDRLGRKKKGLWLEIECSIALL